MNQKDKEDIEEFLARYGVQYALVATQEESFEVHPRWK
jgi:hypothetical protein